MISILQEEGQEERKKNSQNRQLIRLPQYIREEGESSEREMNGKKELGETENL